MIDFFYKNDYYQLLVIINVNFFLKNDYYDYYQLLVIINDYYDYY